MSIILQICNKTILSIVLMLSSTTSTLASVPTSASKEVFVAGKAYDDSDCLKYLDRPIREYGYQPIQIIIKNNSNRNLIFSPDQISLPCARVEEITEPAHTSTVGRVVTYSAATLFVSVLFLIPAIVDGVKSSQANRALDSDYFAKTAKPTVIAPHTKMNSVIFVPAESYTDAFQITLLEEGTDRAMLIPVTMYY